MFTDRTTLTQFLIEERRRHPAATGDLNALILNVALACKAIANEVACGALARVDAAAARAATNVHGEAQTTLDVVANDIFVRTTEWGGQLVALASEELESHYPIPARFPRGRYLLAFDPLDGSSNVDVNVAVGSIFSILRAPDDAGSADAFLQPGARQVCAGYAIYGPSTMFVLTVGTGVFGFTLDPLLGEFFLTHSRMQIPAATREFAINASNSRFWEPAVRRYVDECLAGSTGPRGKDFNMRWIASLVAEAHRILMRGGVFMYPRDSKDPARPGRLRLLYEANPVGLIVEQAGGRASTGRAALLDLVPEALHQRTPFVFGSREEVELIEAYHRDAGLAHYDAPLFGTRGLFRAAA
jgi:fructose-1,6-bisphosphatase I/sedoheptulose-1,7-bisphosphatase